MKSFGITEKELGMIYSKENTIFRVWSPLKDDIKLILYKEEDLKEKEIFSMKKEDDGVHELVLEGDYKGMFYNYLIDKEFEVTDPYSISSSINSRASAIIDLKDTDPKGFKDHKSSYDEDNDCPIVYEAHIKDFTVSENSGVEHRGKYLGFVEEGTSHKGMKTGIDHLKELGVTHIHLMPVYDFFTVNEEKEEFLEDENYNWGYDPELYNTPEGSYSLEPNDPISRIKELKILIMKLHENGFKVILDVVYNHTYKSFDSNFNYIMPNYYYRMTDDGRFSDGGGVGNEIDTEKPMARKFILDSLIYWVEQYQVDGFRFDLLGLIDIDTTREIVKTLKSIKPDIFIYGEPWVAGKTTLDHDKMSLKGTQRSQGFAYFNDVFRDALRGDNNGFYPGFTHSNMKYKWDTVLGIAGSIDYNGTHKGFADYPSETINYLDSHDDLIFYDKVAKVFPDMLDEEIEEFYRFAFSILFTSQGIPFMTSGNEFLRTKNGLNNTYNFPISVNEIDWDLKTKNRNFYKYFKELIQFRKEHPELCLKTPEEINKRLKFMDFEKNKNIIVYTIKSEDGYLLVVHNGKFEDSYIEIDHIMHFINQAYDVKRERLDIKKVFGIDGIVDGKFIKTQKEIYIPYITSYIYKIK